MVLKGILDLGFGGIPIYGRARGLGFILILNPRRSFFSIIVPHWVAVLGDGCGADSSSLRLLDVTSVVSFVELSTCKRKKK